MGDAVILVGDERFRGPELLFQSDLIGMEGGSGQFWCGKFCSEELRVPSCWRFLFVMGFLNPLILDIVAPGSMIKMYLVLVDHRV